MTIAAGVFKQLTYKYESALGTAPGQSSGQQLRRVSSSLDLNKDTYASNEINPTLQMQDFRHGVRRPSGNIQGELSPATYKDFFALILKRDFAAVTATTGASVTIAGSGPTYTVTRGAGSWLTDGLKVGDVVRLSVGSLNAANINKNLLITDITSATVFAALPLNGVALVAEGPIASTTITVVGKKTYVPSSGHTDKSLAIEHWYSDISQSELYLGCKLPQCAIALPPTGIATIDWTVAGLDMADVASKRGSVALSSQYFTSPTAVTSTGLLTAVTGIARVAGASVATITGGSISITANYTGDPVWGSNILPGLFPGRVLISGQLTMYFDSVTVRDLFTQETEAEVVVALAASNDAAADFLTFVMPRCKFNGSSKDDGEKGLVQTVPFQALYNSTGGTGVKTEKTTFSMQDSAA